MLVGTFNQEKALIGALSVNVKSSFEALVSSMYLQTSWAVSPSPSCTVPPPGLSWRCPPTATPRLTTCLVVSRLRLSLMTQVQAPWSRPATPEMVSWHTVALPAYRRSES